MMRKLCPVATRYLAVLALSGTLLGGCGGETPEAMLASGKALLEKKDTKSAIIQIKNALQKQPDIPEGRFLLGRALLESGDANSAVLELRKALELRYSADEAAPLLMRALLAAGQADKVIEEAGKQVVLSPESKANIEDTLSVAYATKGNRDGAVSANQRSLAAKGDYPTARLTQARLMAGSGDLPGGLRLVSSLLEKSPSLTEGWKLKGDILAAMKSLDEAALAYRKAIETQADNVTSRAALISTLVDQSKIDLASAELEQLRKVAPGHPHTLYHGARLAAMKRDFKTARDLSLELLKVAPNNPLALLQAAYVEYELKSWSQAERYASQALQSDPDQFGARRVLARTFLARSEPAKAIGVITPVLSKIGNDAEMLSLAAESYMQNGDLAKGEEFYTRASKVDPRDLRKQTALALARIARGNTDTAIADMERIAATDTDTSADLALISLHLRRGSYDLSLKAVDRLQKKMPDNAVVHNLRGRIMQLGKQDLVAARKSYMRAIELNPAFLSAASSLAEIDMLEKKPEDAKKRFESVLAVAPKNAQAMVYMADLLYKTGASADELGALLNKAVAADPLEPTARIALAGYYVRMHDTKKAVLAIQEGVAAIPDRPDLVELLGRLQLTAGEHNQALATFSKLETLMPGSPDPHLRAAQVYVAMKNIGAATESLKRALTIKPGSAEAHRGLVNLDMSAGKDSDALKVAREVQKQRPEDVIGYMLEGDVHAARKSWGEAAAAYRTGLKRVPVSELAIKLLVALLAADKASEADAFSAAWLKANPKDWLFIGLLAESSLARADYRAAEKYFRTMVELTPTNAVLLNNLAWVAGQQKKPDAIEIAERANKLAPNQPSIMDTLAQLLLERGDVAKALDLYVKALELAPSESVIRLNYARTLLKAGKKSEAKKELDTLAALGDKFARKAEVTELLKTL